MHLHEVDFVDEVCVRRNNAARSGNSITTHDPRTGSIAVVITMLELGGVYVFEFWAVTRITLSVGLRLWPLSAERAFISAGLTRAVLELGHPKEYRFGIDPRRKRYALLVCLKKGMYMGKRQLSKVRGKSEKGG